MLTEISIGRQEEYDFEDEFSSISAPKSELTDFGSDLVKDVSSESITKGGNKSLALVKGWLKKEAAHRLQATERRFKTLSDHSEPAPNVEKTVPDVEKNSLFHPNARKTFPGMFVSPYFDDAKDCAIWERTADHVRVRNAQSARGKRSRALEQKLAVEFEDRLAVAATVTEVDLTEARAQLYAWFAPMDTLQKRNLFGREDELVMLWRAWTISTRRLGREPKPGEFAKDVEAIGVGEFVTTRDKQRARHRLMVELHNTTGPWQEL